MIRTFPLWKTPNVKTGRKSTCAAMAGDAKTEIPRAKTAIF
jgi:hypothetical protein